MNPTWPEPDLFEPRVSWGVKTSQVISQRLAKAAEGDIRSMELLVPLVYAELRALASTYLQHERSHTLQPTALVHEAILKLVGHDDSWSGKDHFKAVAAKAMRQVLVDHARSRNAIKRGGERVRSNIEVSEVAADERGGGTREMQVEELDELLNGLAATSPRLAEIAEMRLFGGMEAEQISRVIGLSAKSVRRDWRIARAYLAGKLKERQRG